MTSQKSENDRPEAVLCDRCREKIEAGRVYHHGSKILCESCCLEARISRSRKTHWQYIGSIKGDYLIPGRKK